MSREAAREARGRRNTRSARGLKQLPWRNHRNNYDPIRVLSDDQIEAIHRTSLRILWELGIDFLEENALRILKENGARRALEASGFLRPPHRKGSLTSCAPYSTTNHREQQDTCM